MAKTDGKLLSPQAEEELLGDEKDPRRTDSTSGDQDPIYGMIENVNKSLGTMADSLLAMNQSLKRLNSSGTFRRCTEWCLKKSLFTNACAKLSVIPDIDLVTSRVNCQITPYVSYRADPEAFAINAFHMS